MSVHTAIALIATCFLQGTLSDASGDGNVQSYDNTQGIFQIFAKFPNAVAIYDNDESGSHMCLTTTRINFDSDGPSATYVWQMKGLNGHARKDIIFHIKPGNKPDEVLFWLDSDQDKERVARVIYADFKTCGIIQLPISGVTECMLWVTKEVKDDVPEHCTEQYEQHCDAKILEYDKDICSQVDSGL